MATAVSSTRSTAISSPPCPVVTTTGTPGALLPGAVAAVRTALARPDASDPAIRTAGVAPFEMTVEGAGAFPTARRPKTLWVGVGDGRQELVALHDALEPPLLDLGCYRREDRQYTPHLTLGRVKGDAGGDRLSVALARQAGWRGGAVGVREVLVMSSELRKEGPTYTVVGRGKLAGS